MIKIENDQHMEHVTKAVQDYHVLNLKSSDFQRTCLPQDALDTLFQMSLKSEKTLYPELFHDNSTAEAELRSDFEIAAKTILCKLNVEKTLADEVWKRFFNRTSVTSPMKKDS